MAENRVAVESEVGEAVQSAMVRMARSEHQKDGVDAGGGRKAAAPGEIDADAVENDRARGRTDAESVLGEI